MEQIMNTDKREALEGAHFDGLGSPKQAKLRAEAEAQAQEAQASEASEAESDEVVEELEEEEEE